MIELTVICGLSVIALFSLCAWQTVDRQRERQEVRAERADLLLRISETQQQTVVRHFNESVPDSPPAITPDDDEDFWLNKEALAEAAAREELNGD